MLNMLNMLNHVGSDAWNLWFFRYVDYVDMLNYLGLGSIVSQKGPNRGNISQHVQHFSNKTHTFEETNKTSFRRTQLTCPKQCFIFRRHNSTWPPKWFCWIKCLNMFFSAEMLKMFKYLGYGKPKGPNRGKLFQHLRNFRWKKHFSKKYIRHESTYSTKNTFLKNASCNWSVEYADLVCLLQVATYLIEAK